MINELHKKITQTLLINFEEALADLGENPNCHKTIQHIYNNSLTRQINIYRKELEDYQINNDKKGRVR